MKPDPRFFNLLIESTEPEKLIFVDDSQENIDAAKKLGIKSILFTSNKKLFTELGSIFDK